MINTRNRSLEIATKFLDLFLINLSWWLAYFLRFEANLLQAQSGLFEWYLKYSVLLTFVSYYFFRSQRVYQKKSLTTLAQDLVCILKANTISFLIFIVY